MQRVVETPAALLPVFHVLGNGPSLTTRIIGALPEGAWLGMNSAFRYWHKVGRYPRYYACLDPVVLRSQFAGIRELLDRPEITDFFLHDCTLELAPELEGHPKITLLSQFLARTDLSVPISRLGHEKQTTGALATRFVIEKGHRRIMLIGVDCKYVEQVQGASAAQGIELVITKKITTNPNYFFGDYQATGDRYQVPNPTLHSGNLHLQSFIALRNDLDAIHADVMIEVGSDRSLLSRFGIFPTRPIWSELSIRRIGAIVVPLTPREWPRQIRNLHLWLDPRLRPSMDARTRDTCLHLFVSGAPDEELRRNIEEGLKALPGLRAFLSGVRITFLEIPPQIDHYIRSVAGTDDPCTKSGPNVLFLATMAHCKEYEYVLHVETDCLPVRAGWLDAAEREIERAGTQAWIIGPAYFGPSQLHTAYRLHINGNAIYQTGDPDFQSFLQDTFLETLAHLIRSGLRDLAYDTSLSVAFHNLDALPESLRQQLALALPRFSYSNFIRNVGGSRETGDPTLLDLRAMLEETDQTFMLHGRPGFHFLDGDLTYLPEVYRRLPGVPDESLPLFYVWSNDPAWLVDQQGYGKTLLTAGDTPAPAALMLTFHFARLRDDSTGRRWRLSLLADVRFPAFARATFAFQADDGQVHQIAPTHMSVTDEAGGGSALLFELDTAPALRANAVGVYLHGVEARPAALQLRHIEMIERDAPGSGIASLPLDMVPRSQASVEAIERWHLFYDALPRFGALVHQPQWVHWQSPRFILRHAALRAGHIKLAMTTSGVDQPGAAPQGSLFMGVLAGAPWHRASGFEIEMRLSDATVNGEAVVRMCRHAHTPWEYVDVTVVLCAGHGVARLPRAVFQHEHQSYRLELLRMPATEGAVNLSLDIVATLEEPSPVAAWAATGGLPRLLILDPTIMGTRSATGQIKQLFFGKWPHTEILQVCDLQQADGRVGLVRFSQGEPSWSAVPRAQALQACRDFDPAVIYARPDDNPAFTSCIVEFIEALHRPVALHVMDDWMERSRQGDAQGNDRLQAAMVRLVRCASLHLSICDDMSRMLRVRYGRRWLPLANGVDVSEGSVAHTPPQEGPFVIRYMGGLARDMSLGTVQRVADAVERLRGQVDVRFEIYTMDWYREQAQALLADRPSTSVHGLVDSADYHATLTGSHALLIAYNFDARSLAYTRYSLSNKLPECLASGRPVLLVGPEDVATVREMRGEAGLKIVTSDDADAIAQVIAQLAASREAAQRLGAQGRDLARRRFSAQRVRERAQALMRELAQRPAGAAAPTAARSEPSFKAANAALREGRFEEALDEYARLMALRPLGIYRDNALACLHQLGLDEGSWEHAVLRWRLGA